MSDTPPVTLTARPENEDSLRGFLFALAAYLMWGFLPLYMKALSNIGTLEVLASRVIWSVPVALAILWWLGRTSDLKAALRSPRMLGMAALTAALISVNWGIYVWSIQTGHALDAALGYYINPLFSIFLGAALLGEKLNATQKLAIGLAVAAVAVMTFDAGGLPIIGLSLTVTWGFYAYCKKSLPIGPNQGFTLEVMLLLPAAIGWVAWEAAHGRSSLFAGSTRDILLLIGCGPVTALPLMTYANGAKLLRLSTIGIMQYIAPTMIFLTAVFIFGEEFGQAQMIAFPLIWLGLVIYSTAMFRRARAAGR
ncbi:MAG: EamA family transporter RarD [Proteobacteria bacterium]|nr:EamA family transporter RarD [Pseudomonadota bacterium]MBS0572471.1 EamA family transporter RarD [Pseudomonadota bacterium]